MKSDQQFKYTESWTSETIFRVDRTISDNKNERSSTKPSFESTELDRTTRTKYTATNRMEDDELKPRQRRNLEGTDGAGGKGLYLRMREARRQAMLLKP